MSIDEDILELVKQWLIKAEHDLGTIEREFQENQRESYTDIICFHAQQAIEKYLKAYLIFNKTNFSKTHNLEILKELSIKIDKNFNNLELGKLNDYAIDIRYADDFYMPTLKEAEEAYDLALKAKEFILPKIII